MWTTRRRIVAGVLLLVAVLLIFLLVSVRDHRTLQIRTPVAAGDPNLPEYLARLLGAPLTRGDAYVVHVNEAAVAAMLHAITQAKARIGFETYIYDEGKVGGDFARALEDAARRGVQVRMVLDAFGASSMDDEHVARLERAGVRIGWFNQGRSLTAREVNHRTHRKALVVDGEVAFVGGVGVADHWAHAVDGIPPWRDTQVEVRGAAAINIEAAFNENWMETGGVVEPDMLPHDEPPAGSARSIVIWSSPQGGANAMKLLYLLSIGSARETIDIQSPYLVLDDTTWWSLTEARERGVRIRAVVEGEITDAKPVKYASRADYERLMENGIEIYEYEPTMMHTKAIIVDGVLSIVGSANFDNRSLELNDELNVAIFDRALAERLVADFEADIGDSVRLNLDEWRDRPLPIKMREQFWSVFGELF